ncbi:MFS transporter [Yinghuangia aomiensis]|uniref:MFS transporter n=1 Tax=Yinghuangia aomiensis TaxID=676205 RepID=A0ABP9HP72_9ACTN
MAEIEVDADRARVVSPALLVVCLGYFMVILDSTIVNVALPALARELGTGVSGLQWVVDSYLVVLAAGLLSGGALADRFGARRIFHLGLWLFVAASLGCGLASQVSVLVAARVVQAAGAALTVPASLALLRAMYARPGARARAVGVWGSVAGLAAASGPVLGGVLVEAASWRWVFFVNIPIGLAAIALSRHRVPAPEPRERGLDPAGQLTGVLALTALALALIEGGHRGFDALVIGGAVVFVVAAAAFVMVERAAANPMLPLTLFRSPTFTGGSAVGLLINLGFYGQLFVLNLYFQQVRDYSALQAGLALLPQMGVVVLGSTLSGRFTGARGSPRRTVLTGLPIAAVGMFGLASAASGVPYLLLVPPLMASGFGMSFTMPAATTAVTDSAPAERAGLASGVINAARQTGSVIGVALIGALVGSGAPDAWGVRAAFAAAGGSFVAAAVVTLVTIDRPGRA